MDSGAGRERVARTGGGGPGSCTAVHPAGGTNEVLRGMVAKEWACDERRAWPMSVLRGGVFASGTDDLTDLRRLVVDIGERSYTDRIGHRGLPDPLDATAWRHLEDAGLTRLGSTGDSGGGPARWR